MSQNHYQILGVSTTATAREIKLAYKRLAVQYHPDKHGGNTLYEDLFKAVAAAYHILGEPGRRAQYDHQLQIAARRAEEARRQQQYRAQAQHLYGVPMPPPAPLRTRRPAGSAERHYRTIPRQRQKFTRRDYWLTAMFLLGLLLFVLSVKVTMDHVTAVSNYDDGIEAYTRREWSTAHSFFTETLHFKPKHTAALQRRAELEQLIYHDYVAAAQDYRAAIVEIESSRRRAALLSRLGQCHAALQHPDSAQQAFRQALALDSTVVRALLARGEAELFQRRRYASAIRDFSAGLRHTRSSVLLARLMLYRGLAHYKHQDYGAARADYWQVLTLTPRSGQVYFLLGRVAQKEGALPDACEFFRRAVVQGYQFAEDARNETCGRRQLPVTPVQPARN
ncbi:Tetratricopeptide repeat-containing protein [Hymenobacter gelipurpurascens]|uniref:Tetratricopeptide repeat-containing protein n=1 Tax=Hymenobacter gelipurpurascens TaxID=89968 RepID=A0A212UG20_9BACT|nr:J domain-containing protein [Hymenobacter gelipurpurascens]SNC77081.1 Tetratricopeptide repeat-containing protein [Hymenobacter gelipurpurascens]